MIGKALVACEESQAVCIALRAKGWEAYSCDILPCSGGHPEWHIQGDVRHVMIPGYLKHFTGENVNWDLVISFPPCTHLAISGAKHFEKKRLSGEQEEGIMFFLALYNHSNVLENPVGVMNGGEYLKKWFPFEYKLAVDLGVFNNKPQIIQPYQYGEPFTKTTCLWLKGLPKLIPTNIVDKGKRVITKGGNSLPEWYNIPPTDPDRAKKRSKTFPGIAQAMADQWTDYYLKTVCGL